MTSTDSPPTIFAATGNRAAALLLDLILLSFASGQAVQAGLALPYAFPSLVFAYFAGMPLTPLQGTLGKWICRIKLCDRQGRRLGWRASALRAGATMCWFAPPFLLGEIASLGGVEGASLSITWWLLFALPWAPAGFLPRRESLFDLLAGSLVVRYRADTESIASAEPAQTPGILNTAGNVLVCLAAGAALSVMVGAQHDMNRRGRVAYAIEQTRPLREKVEVFQVRERRMPTAGELGVPEWTPYPDGGGYRLQDGGILITFTKLPELKGHSIFFRPAPAGDGKKVQWQCSADPGFKRGYLPSSCR
jgi:uncharacterized RDD family membrane protein YckC